MNNGVASILGQLRGAPLKGPESAESGSNETPFARFFLGDAMVSEAIRDDLGGTWHGDSEEVGEIVKDGLPDSVAPDSTTAYPQVPISGVREPHWSAEPATIMATKPGATDTGQGSSRPIPVPHMASSNSAATPTSPVTAGPPLPGLEPQPQSDSATEAADMGPRVPATASPLPPLGQVQAVPTPLHGASFSLALLPADIAPQRAIGTQPFSSEQPPHQAEPTAGLEHAGARRLLATGEKSVPLPPAMLAEGAGRAAHQEARPRLLEDTQTAPATATRATLNTSPTPYSIPLGGAHEELSQKVGTTIYSVTIERALPDQHRAQAGDRAAQARGMSPPPPEHQPIPMSVAAQQPPAQQAPAPHALPAGLNSDGGGDTSATRKPAVQAADPHQAEGRSAGSPLPTVSLGRSAEAFRPPSSTDGTADGGTSSPVRPAGLEPSLTNSTASGAVMPVTHGPVTTTPDQHGRTESVHMAREPGPAQGEQGMRAPTDMASPLEPNLEARSNTDGGSVGLVPLAAIAPRESATHQPLPMPGPATQAHATLHLAAQIAEISRPLPQTPIELSLDPQELGHVRMTFTQDGATLNVAISAERHDTLEMLRRHVSLLAQDLRNAGLGDTSFSFGSDRPPPRNPEGQPDQGSAAVPAPATAETRAPPPHPRLSRANSATEGIDIRL